MVHSTKYLLHVCRYIHYIHNVSCAFKAPEHVVCHPTSTSFPHHSVVVPIAKWPPKQERNTHTSEGAAHSMSYAVLHAATYLTNIFRADQTDNNRDQVSVYYAVDNGKGSDIHCADTSGHHSKLFSLESNSPLLGLFWYSHKRQLVSVARTGDLYIHAEEEGQDRWQQLVTMKIGGGAAADGPALMVAWVGGQTLASATGKDGTVRMYDLDTEDNYILRIGKIDTSAHTSNMHAGSTCVEHAGNAGILLHFIRHMVMR